MKIIITSPDGENTEYDFDKNSIILGRSERADITISDHHISRQHLEIKKIDDLYYIRDKTLSNWISYNNEKLEKNTDIQYYDFAPLVLPGGHKVKIEDELLSSSKLLRSHTVTKSITKVNSDGEKIVKVANIKKKKKKKKYKKRDAEDSTERKNMLLTLILAICFGIYYLFFLKQEPLSQVYSNPSSVNKQIKKKILVTEPRVQQTVTRERLSPLQKSVKETKKCHTAELKKLCNKIFLKVTRYEGFFYKDNTLFVFKNYDSRGALLFRSKVKFNNNRIEREKLLKIIAGEGILLPSFLQLMEQKKILKIKVYLFKLSRKNISVIKTFAIDSTDYRKYSQEDYIKAYSSIASKHETSLFDTQIAKIIKQEKE